MLFRSRRLCHRRPADLPGGARRVAALDGQTRASHVGRLRKSLVKAGHADRNDMSFELSHIEAKRAVHRRMLNVD